VRLYLSSYRLGDHPEEWVRLLGGGRRIAVISNAIDAVQDSPDVDRAAAIDDQLADLARLGLSGADLDLRDFFRDPSGAAFAAALEPYDGVWVRGGNSFVLRVAMARSGADRVLTGLLAADRIVYAGYSAGPAVLAPSLRGIELVDPLDGPQQAYGAEPIWAGLGVLDYAFVPHFDSAPHPEAELIDGVVERYRTDGTPYRTVRDGQAIVVDGDDDRLV
jgi:dipeptidase E